MKVRRNLLYLILLICLAGFFMLEGCLQDFLPREQQQKEEPELIIPGEDKREQFDKEKEKLPEGVLYLQVYFLEGRGNYLLPVTITLPWTEGVGRAALEKLIEGPTPAQEMRYGLSSPIPPTTEVLGLKIRDGLAKLDLSGSFLSYDPGEERSVLNGIIFTLLQFPTVKDVQLLVEGIAPEVFPGGTPGKGTFSRERGINLEVAEDISNFEDAQLVTLYFCTALGDNHIFYVPVSRVVAGNDDIFKVTIEELLKGPRPGGFLFSELPAGTELRSFTLNEGTLLVNFSSELLNYKGGLSGEKNIYAQIVLTLTEIPGVERVQLLVEGKKIILNYGTSFQEPLSRPLLINPLI
jgi:germination protein M